MTNWESILYEAGRLHDEAMGYATQARLLQAQGKQQEEAVCLRQAFERASQAASMLAEAGAPEPSRSIIHRSAASLAVRLGDMPGARELIHRAMEGRPEDQIRSELEVILDSLPITDNSRLAHSKTPLSPKQLLSLMFPG